MRKADCCIPMEMPSIKAERCKSEKLVTVTLEIRSAFAIQNYLQRVTKPSSCVRGSELKASIETIPSLAVLSRNSRNLIQSFMNMKS